MPGSEESKPLSDLIRHLQSFNRKERFILLREALGTETLRVALLLG